MSRFKPSSETLTASDGSVRENKRPRIKPAPVNTAIVSSPAAPLAPALEFDNSPNPARQFALKCTLIFLYFRFSFVHEFIASTIHFDFHILIILGLVSYAAWFIAGNMFRAFEDRLSWLWTFYTGLLCVVTITSSWRGGSFPIVLDWMRTIYPLLLLLPAVIWTPDDLKRVMNTIGLAGASTVAFGLLHRGFTEGRMDIGTAGGSIQDPNDFAAHVTMMLPAIAFYFFSKERPAIFKLMGAGLIGAALLEIMSTGSRGGFVALLIMTVYIVLTGSTKIRLALLLGAPTLALLALPFVPQQAFQRIASIFNAGEESKSAAESSEARRALLIASLKTTIQNPIFGVGPGTFEEYEANLAAERHQKGMWHETHNGYTQISSECGIPAIALYLTIVVLTFKSLKRATRSAIPIVAGAARTLATMAVGWSAAIIFLANGYRFCMLVIGAIVVSINLIDNRAQRATAQL